MNWKHLTPDTMPKDGELVLVTNGSVVGVAVFIVTPGAEGDIVTPTFPQPMHEGKVTGWLPLSALPPLPPAPP